MSKTFAKNSEYPLRWPGHIPRTTRPESSRFKTTLYKALQNVTGSLQLLAQDSGKKVENVSLTSNITIDTTPSDGGVAVYFSWNEADMCIPVDRYKTPAENLQAIHHIIEADRTKLRHGGLAFVMAEKRGKTVLSIPEKTGEGWREIFEGAQSEDEAKLLFRSLVKKHHPDVPGGDEETYKRIYNAYAEFLKQAQFIQTTEP